MFRSNSQEKDLFKTNLISPSNDRLIKQSFIHSVIQSVSQAASQSYRHTETDSQSVGQQASQSTIQSVRQFISQLVKQPASQRNIQSVSQSFNNQSCPKKIDISNHRIKSGSQKSLITNFLATGRSEPRPTTKVYHDLPILLHSLYFKCIKIPVIPFYFSDQQSVWQFPSGHFKCFLSSSFSATETFQTSPLLLITSMTCFPFSCLAGIYGKLEKLSLKKCLDSTQNKTI